MSDSDMDIDDDDVQVRTIAVESVLLDTPIQASDSQNDVKKHSVDQPNIIKESGGTFENSQANISGNSGKSIKLEDEKGTTLSRFPVPGIMAQSFTSGNEREQKRAAILCKFFAKGWCVKGKSCRFLHVNETKNSTSQQQVDNNMAGSNGVQSVEERRTSDSKNGVRVSQLSENGVTSLPTRGDIAWINPPGCQRVFPSTSEMRFINNSNPFSLRSSFVHEHTSSVTSYRKTGLESSGPAWTGSLFSSVPMNQYASNLGHFDNRNMLYGSGSLPTLQGISVSSDQDAEGNTTSNNKKVSSNDWEPSDPFQPSFTIPPYILPSSDALYDPFTDIENLEDKSLNAPSSSKGKHAQKNSGLQKDGEFARDSQARDCNNDDNNSSCSPKHHQETVAKKKLEGSGIVEGVATSVVDQNDATTSSKELSSSAAAENRAVIKKCKLAGHESWHRSDGSSHQKILKSDEIDGEVRSDAGMKVMRQFRAAVVETIKEMLKPLWREGRLTKDVHNMIVKRAAEKIVSAAVQFHQVPTETESVAQYLSMSAPKIVKLVEGYVEKYGKPSGIK